MADAGENEKKMLEVLERATKQAEDSGAKIATESFNGLTLHIVQFPPQEEPKDDADKAKDKTKPPPDPPLVWTNAGSLFFIASDLERRSKTWPPIAMAATTRWPRPRRTRRPRRRPIPSKAQVVWYLDVNKLVKLVIKANTKERRGPADRGPGPGTGRLRSQVGRRLLDAWEPGTTTASPRRSSTPPGPCKGCSRSFRCRRSPFGPSHGCPPRSPATRPISFDLDNAFTALNDLVNKFQPGMINLVEQQLVGPNGGQPLSFQNDIFGPLGDRITVISDFKKPIKEDSQRMLVAVALEDTKAFQNTLSKLLELAGAAPEKREFQGTTIYDFDVNLPNQARGRRSSASRARSASRSPRTPSS